MSIGQWENNNDFSFFVNAKEKIKNKYLFILLIDNKTMKCKLRQLRNITLQFKSKALADQTDIVEHALNLSLQAT